MSRVTVPGVDGEADPLGLEAVAESADEETSALLPSPSTFFMHPTAFLTSSLGLRRLKALLRSVFSFFFYILIHFFTYLSAFD